VIGGLGPIPAHPWEAGSAIVIGPLRFSQLKVAIRMVVIRTLLIGRSGFVVVNDWCKYRLNIAKRQGWFEPANPDQILNLDRTVGP